MKCINNQIDKWEKAGEQREVGGWLLSPQKTQAHMKRCGNQHTSPSPSSEFHMFAPPGCWMQEWSLPGRNRLGHRVPVFIPQIQITPAFLVGGIANAKQRIG